MQFQKVMRRAFASVLLAVMAMVCCMPSALADFKVKINSSSTFVYKRPSSSSTRLAKSVKGITVTVTDYSGKWAEISYRGRTGYMQIKYLNLQNRITAYTEKKTPVYRLASSSSSKLGTLSGGTRVYVIGVDGSYCRVQDKSGSVTGYIRTSHLSTEKPVVSETVTSSSSSSSSGSAVSQAIASGMPSGVVSNTSKYSSGMSRSQKLEYAIYVAQNQLGKRYSSDANPPSTYDCAHLVRYCYDKAGFDVAASAYNQGYDNDYRKITSISDLERGDMVCFNTNPSDDDLCDHTGIYLGKGYFIHASSAAGKVIVSKLDEGYYNTNFSWGRDISK